MEALKDAKVLEGKMNGATANVWRDFMGDTGGNGERSLFLSGCRWLKSGSIVKTVTKVEKVQIPIVAQPRMHN